jgi:signal transduction histidine kinase
MKTDFVGDLSLKWKFILIIIGIIVSITLIQNLIFYALDVNTLNKSLQNKISTLADVLGKNSTSAVQFQSRDDALEVISSLDNEPSVRAAYLFTADGRVLAEYLADQEKLSVPLLDITDQKKIIVSEERISVLRPIILDQKMIGSLYISSDLRELRERTAFRFLFGITVLVGTIIIALLLALWCQKFFIQPILHLSHLSYEIGQSKQYSLRAHKSSNDELGVLADSFNSMLDTIQARDQALDRKTQELEYSNRELEQFAYVISHDLKSPLVTIQGFATRFVKHLAEGNREKSEDSAMRVQNAAKRMGELIDDVLELSRIGRKQAERKLVNLNVELEKVRDDLQGALDQAGVTLAIEDGLPQVYADAGEIRQVFQNLISNAIKYGCLAPGKTITIGSKPTALENNIFVRDQGPGIPKEYHFKIFQLFQRLNKDKQGTGLGLAIVHKVMKSLSGRTWVESEEGKGSTFWLSFPKIQKT